VGRGVCEREITHFKKKISEKCEVKVYKVVSIDVVVSLLTCGYSLT